LFLIIGNLWRLLSCQIWRESTEIQAEIRNPHKAVKQDLMDRLGGNQFSNMNEAQEKPGLFESDP